MRIIAAAETDVIRPLPVVVHGLAAPGAVRSAAERRLFRVGDELPAAHQAEVTLLSA